MKKYDVNTETGEYISLLLNEIEGKKELDDGELPFSTLMHLTYHFQILSKREEILDDEHKDKFQNLGVNIIAPLYRELKKDFDIDVLNLYNEINDIGKELYQKEFDTKTVRPDNKIYTINTRLLLLKELGVIDNLTDKLKISMGPDYREKDLRELIAILTGIKKGTIDRTLPLVGNPKVHKNNPATKKSLKSLDIILDKFKIERTEIVDPK